MAANYWDSTQHKYWQFDRKALMNTRQALEKEESALVQQYPLPDRRHLSIFFNQQLIKLGRRLQTRQQAIATAQIYIRRFYLRVEIRKTNPYLVISTALYLACKMEECPQYIRVIVSEARNIWPEFIVTDVSKLGECEFFLISEMDCQLIVHHPYRTLGQLQNTLNMGQEDVTLAWNIINDHYLTDLPLLYPLHIIAAMAIFFAMTLKPSQGGLQTALATAILSAKEKESPSTENSDNNLQKKKVKHLLEWLAKSEIDIAAMIDSTQEIISLYEVWEQYNDKTCKEQIARFVKARNLDK